MLFVFSAIFVAGTKTISCLDFVAPLTLFIWTRDKKRRKKKQCKTGLKVFICDTVN